MKYTNSNDLVSDLLLCSSTEELKGFFSKTENCVLTKQQDSDLEVVFIEYDEDGLGRNLKTLHLNMMTGHNSAINIYQIIQDKDGPMIEMDNLGYDDQTFVVNFIDHETDKKSQAKLIEIPGKAVYCNYSWREK